MDKSLFIKQTWINLPLESSIHRKAKARAALAGESLQEWIAKRIEEAVQAPKGGKR